MCRSRGRLDVKGVLVAVVFNLYNKQDCMDLYYTKWPLTVQIEGQPKFTKFTQANVMGFRLTLCEQKHIQ